MKCKNNEEWLNQPECGNGWEKIIRDLDAKIKVIAPDYKIFQIKEKFGSLRYYIGGIPVEVSEQVNKLISEAEQLADQTCEICGSPGKLSRRIDSGWLRTVCENCLGDRVFVSEK